MSSFEYYEFRAIDKPLTEKEQNVISNWSSRTTATARRAVFTYSYRSFPYDEMETVATYFDAMFYMSNWGSTRLMFRFPKETISFDVLEPYCTEYGMVQCEERGDYVILDMMDEEADIYWVDGEGHLDEVLALREEIMEGDFRSLYLGWLKNLEYHDPIELEGVEPPVPAGLNELTKAQRYFANQFRVNDVLIEIAAEVSPSLDLLTSLDVEAGIRGLSEEEKVDFLVRFANGEPALKSILINRLQALTQSDPLELTILSSTYLSDEADQREIKRRLLAEQKAEEERIAALEALSDREFDEWEEIEALIEKRAWKYYNEAVERMLKLKEVYVYRKEEAKFQELINEIYTEYNRLSSLKNIMKSKGLVKKESCERL